MSELILILEKKLGGGPQKKGSIYLFIFQHFPKSRPQCRKLYWVTTELIENVSRGFQN